MELSCLAIVALYIAAKGRQDGWQDWPGEFAWTAATAWACEHACIEWYGFYAYHDVWSVFIGHVPLTVALIWPVVILSARDVAAARFAGSLRAPGLLVGGMILWDAALIEPIAVAADLWHWTQPGLFGVPPIGVLGWALFTALWNVSKSKPRWQRTIGTFAGLHASLLALWWAAFRWINVEIPVFPAICALVAVSVALSAVLVYRRETLRPDRARMLLRAPGALFFAGLLAVTVRDSALWIWAATIAAPWIATLAANFGAKR